MNHTKTLFALAAFFALSAGVAEPQVRCKVPAQNVTQQPTKKADTGDGLIMTSFFSTAQAKQCVALTNLQGVPNWSYCTGGNLFMTRAVTGGTILLISNDAFTDYTVSEINKAATTLNSLTEATANSELAALDQQQIIDFNHEAMRLPSGDTAVIAHNEKLFTNVQGGTPQKPVDVMGDEVLVLNTNWNIVWTWNAFTCPNCATALPVSRTAILGETCKPCAQITSGGCCPITLAPQANDWLHGNSLTYDSTDGNLIMSLRSQDWIIKIDYANGTGDGHIIWVLGNPDEGSVQSSAPGFTMLNTPNIPSPWFSHQHDVEIWTNESPKILTLFDNGNTRHSTDPGADSRGQALIITENAPSYTNMTVDFHTNIDFSFYSAAYGTSQILDNGNYWWQAGVVGGQDGTDPTRSTEYLTSGYTGTAEYSIQFADTAYRSFRLDAASGFGGPKE